jgi:radical SAM-linked protein
MEKMRVALAKSDATQFVGHLDFGRAVERALRRAKLPVAYSEGFNPHMKLSFGPALGVGIASDAEYIDVELASSVSEDEFKSRLSPQLPPGLAFVAAHPVMSSSSLAATLNLACYQAEVAMTGTQDNETKAQAALEAFHAADSLEHVRHTPKGEKTMDLKKYMVGGLSLELQPASTTVRFWLRMTSAGAVKPQEIISVLMSRFGFPAGETAYCRKVLRCDTGDGVKTAFEI